jgi:DSF synthase
MQQVSRMQHPLEKDYSHLSVRFDSERGVLWTLLDPKNIPCFNLDLLGQLRAHHDDIESHGNRPLDIGHRQEVRYSVLASLTPGIFNLGGQLALFKELIRSGNRDALLHYATKCIDVINQRVHHFNSPLATITLLQGDALGGGFEAALTSDIIIAERRSQMGFPEILFNLFPGMGAYSLVARKVNPKFAEKMILGGKMYSAEELFEAGLVDILVEDGKGVEAVNDYIRKQERRSNGFQAVQKARHRFNPVTLQELMDITTVWVDAALKLNEKDLKVMDRFVRSQEKLFLQPQIKQPEASSAA